MWELSLTTVVIGPLVRCRVLRRPVLQSLHDASQLAGQFRHSNSQTKKAQLYESVFEPIMSCLHEL